MYVHFYNLLSQFDFEMIPMMKSSRQAIQIASVGKWEQVGDEKCSQNTSGCWKVTASQRCTLKINSRV